MTYQIKLPQFEGPFDLLLFFIERDELDIYNIPISQITGEFLAYIRQLEALNIDLASEFILFISTLMRIKAKTLLPRREMDAQGHEIDPRQELIDKLLEYKRYKEASETLARMEARHPHERGEVLPAPGDGDRGLVARNEALVGVDVLGEDDREFPSVP